MIRLGTPADLSAAAPVYRRASLSNPGHRDSLLAAGFTGGDVAETELGAGYRMVLAIE